jgi:hypothetical protein
MAHRYLLERELPPYSYVTGRYPHPTRDPDGHSFGYRENKPRALDPEHWQESEEYLFGIDLFNHGYYWEAHEAWESLWLACGRTGATAEFLKGLIKLAAAGVKAREGRTEGVRRHARRATELLENVKRQQATTMFAGLDLEELLEHARSTEQRPPATPEEAQAVEVVFEFLLLPRL